VGEGYDPLDINSWNIAANHRYTASGQGGLYFASGERVVEAEFVNNGSSLNGKVVHDFPNSSVSDLLDLTNPAARQGLGLSLSDLTRTGGTTSWRYEFTQPVGAWAEQNGYRGIIAPSAQADGGVNVILFNAKGVR
jgi:filamentous hemagglutinin